MVYGRTFYVDYIALHICQGRTPVSGIKYIRKMTIHAKYGSNLAKFMLRDKLKGYRIVRIETTDSKVGYNKIANKVTYDGAPIYYYYEFKKKGTQDVRYSFTRHPCKSDEVRLDESTIVSISQLKQLKNKTRLNMTV